MNPSFKVIKPLHTERVVLAVASFGSDSEEIKFPVDADMFVQDIVVTMYDQDGAVYPDQQSRDRVVISMKSNNSDEDFVKMPIDAFALNQTARSNAWRGFVVKRSTQLEITVDHTNDAGATKFNSPLVVEVAFIGQKVQRQS